MTKKEAIAERAYQLWIARGRAHGSEEEDWLEAERQMSSTEDANELNHGANGAGAVRVVSDEGMARGECVLETSVGTVELGIEAQLEEIERGFFDLMQRRPA